MERFPAPLNHPVLSQLAHQDGSTTSLDIPTSLLSEMGLEWGSLGSLGGGMRDPRGTPHLRCMSSVRPPPPLNWDHSNREYVKRVHWGLLSSWKTCRVTRRRPVNVVAVFSCSQLALGWVARGYTAHQLCFSAVFLLSMPVPR